MVTKPFWFPLAFIVFFVHKMEVNGNQSFGYHHSSKYLLCSFLGGLWFILQTINLDAHLELIYLNRKVGSQIAHYTFPIMHSSRVWYCYMYSDSCCLFWIHHATGRSKAIMGWNISIWLTAAGSSSDDTWQTRCPAGHQCEHNIIPGKNDNYCTCELTQVYQYSKMYPTYCFS